MTAKKQSILSKIMKFAVPLIVTVGLCYVLFKGLDFNEMMAIISEQCDFRWIALALALSISSHVWRAFRWRIQLRALGVDAPRFALVLSIFGTYAVNLVFPRLGEVWRTGYIATRQKAPFATVFGSMVADRLADTVTVALLTLLTFCLASGSLLAYLRQNEATYQALMGLVTSPWLWAAIVATVAGFWWLLTRRRGESSIITKIQNFAKGLWDGFAVIARMPGKGRWLGYTAMLWGTYFLQLYVAFFAFPFTASVVEAYGVTAVLVTFVLSSISMGVPSNGGIGPWQWAVIFALGIYGVDRTAAGAFANLVLGTQTALLVALGLFTFICIFIENKKKQNIENE